MLIKDQTQSVRTIETPDDFAETRLEAIGYVYHGAVVAPSGKKAAKAGTNLLHFSRCAKLDKVGDGEAKVWFRTIGAAKQYLDAHAGAGQWKWCKVCEREITQKILNEQ